MNWNGGRLQRHSKPNNNAIAKQRQHFARIQQTLHRGTQKQTPKKWNILGNIVEGSHQTPRDVSEPPRSAKEYSRERSQSVRARPDSLRKYQTIVEEHDAREWASDHGSYRDPHPPVFIKPEPQELARIPDDDLYNASPPRRSKQPPRDGNASHKNRRDSAENEELSLLEKRRRILRKGDWVGVSIQKPIGFKFASPNSEDNVGKRRQVKAGNGAKYATKQARMTSPFQNPEAQRTIRQWIGDGPQPQDQARADVRISIGRQIVEPGQSSNMAFQNQRVRSLSVTTRRSSISKAISTDEMLLDNAPIHQQTLGLNRRLSNSNHPELLRLSSPVSRQRPRSGSLLSERDRIISSNGYHRNGRQSEVSHWARIGSENDIIAQRVYKNRKRPPNPATCFTTSSVTSRAVSTSLVNPHQQSPVHPIFSSSSACLQHPKPQRSETSVLLRSKSTEVAESTIAQVCLREPTVPSSQVLENNRWENWIAPSDYGDDTEESIGRSTRFGRHQQVSISPGISTAVPRRTRRIATAYNMDADKSDTVASERSLNLRESSSQHNWSEHNSPDENRLDTPVAISERPFSTALTPVTIPDAPLASPLFNDTRKRSIPEIRPPQISKDDDEIWRKFVFGNSDEDFKDAELDPRRRDTEQEGCSSASLRVQPSLKDLGSPVYRDWATLNDNPQSTGCESSHSSSPNDNVDCTLQGNVTSSEKFSSEGGGKTTIHPFRDPIPSSDSIPIVAMPTSSINSDPASFLSVRRGNLRLQSKSTVMFTKPKQFIGHKSEAGLDLDQEPFHIGKGLGTQQSSHNMKKERNRKRDIYSLVSSEDQIREDELESIEDD